MVPDLATPRQSRVGGLPFASRRSPFVSSQFASTRRHFNRDDPPRSKLSSNVFSASERTFGGKSSIMAPVRTAVAAQTRSGAFSPDVFAPGASPAPKKLLFRSSVASEAQTTPLRRAAASTKPDLFQLKIPDPPAHLTGASLADKVPDYLQQRGSVYADQYLADICPSEFDEDQRRQFFCILDLRRLKYAADEIFAKKDWKLNVMNFAKEFDKSRSMIMLRYGLYEFKNVKPSEEVLRKWRAAHGLPDPQSISPRTNGVTGAKRKAEEQLVKESSQPSASPAKNKRRVTERDIAAQPAVAASSPVPATTGTLSPAKNKRKATVADEHDETVQPVKTPRSKTLAAFTDVYSNLSNGSTPASSKPAAAPTSNSFNGVPRGGHVPTTSKPATEPTTNSFGHISDTDSEAEGNNNGADDNMPVPKDLTSATKSAGPGPSGSNSSGNVESTAGRSFFDRIQKDPDGQPVRVPQEVAAPAAQAKPANQSWDIGTPVKFAAPSTSATIGPSLFSVSTPATGSIFGPKPTPTPAQKTDGQEEIADGSTTADKSVDESDKENSSGNQPKPAGIFGTGVPKPAPAFSSSTSVLFGAQKDETTTPAKPISTSFGAQTAAPALGSKTGGPTTGLFVAKIADTPARSLFGASSTGSATGLFSPKPSQTKREELEPAKSADAPVPTFGVALLNQTAKEPVEISEEKSAEHAQPSQSVIFGAASDKPTSVLLQSSSQPGNITKMDQQPKESARPTVSFGGKTGLFQGSFGSASAEDVATKPVIKTGLFGAQILEDKPSPVFGASQPETKSSVLFGIKQPEAKPTFMFGASQPPKPSIFGGSQPSNPSDAPSSSLFGATSQTAPPKASTPPPTANPFTNAPAMTPAPTPAVNNPLLGAPADASTFGSPMKTDNPSPVKPSGGAVASTNTSNPFSSFGSNTAAAPAQSSSVFGNSMSGQTTTPSIFSQSMAPTASASSSFTTLNSGGNGAGQSFSNPFASGADTGKASSVSFNFNFGGGVGTQDAGRAVNNPFSSVTSQSAAPTPSSSFGKDSSAEPASISFTFGAGAGSGASGAPAAPRTLRGRSPGTIHGRPIATPSKRFGGSRAAPSTTQSVSAPSSFHSPQPFQPPQPLAAPPQSTLSFGSNTSSQPGAGSIFGNSQLVIPAPTTGTTNSPFTFGGTSVATTPAAGTSDPDQATNGGESNDNEPLDAQINLTGPGQGEEDETVLHEVRAKVLKHIASEQAGNNWDSDKAKSPWSRQGVGLLRILRHKETNKVRLLLRGEPRGNIVLNRGLLPANKYEPTEKYVKIVTSNDTGDGLETWMLQTKSKETAVELAAVLEANKMS